MRKIPLPEAAGRFAKGYLERREVEKRIVVLEKQRLTASAAFLAFIIIPGFEQLITEV